MPTVLNPGFELGDNGDWVRSSVCFSSSATIVNAAPNAHTGDWFANIPCSWTFGPVTRCGKWSQTVSGFVIGDQYSCHFWSFRNTVIAARNRDCTLTFGPDTVVLPDGAGDTPWTETVITLTAASTSLEVAMEGAAGDIGSGITTWRFDDISIERVAVPLGTDVFVRRGVPGTVG